MIRKRLRLIFSSWRVICHQWFKERVVKESLQFDQVKRTELLEQYEKRAELLKLYYAQLQEKIRIEVAAKEELQKTYEMSLGRSVGVLKETQVTQVNSFKERTR